MRGDHNRCYHCPRCAITAYGQGTRKTKTGGVFSCGFQWGFMTSVLIYSDQAVLAVTGLVPWEIHLKDKDRTMLDGKKKVCSLAIGCLRSLGTRFAREMRSIYGTEFSAIVQALARKAPPVVSALPRVSSQAAGCSGCTTGSETCLELGISVEER